MITKYRIEDFKGGWFMGNFEPSLLKTNEFECSVKTHIKGEVWEKHYHQEAVEYNFVFEGIIEIDDIEYIKGDIFVVHPGTIVDPIFKEDCSIMCVKTPCVIGDKYTIPRTEAPR
jgi:quercetin dioxygenase-like cupin family protein